MTLLETKNKEELEKFIKKALAKLQVSNENELCKYLPGESSGYMHHFTLRKLKKNNPQHVLNLIKEFIIETDHPKALLPKQRAPRGSRKGKEIFNFTPADIERVLELARIAGDKDLLSKLSPKRSLLILKKDLIRSVRENTIRFDLWNAYVECIQEISQTENESL